MATQLRVAPADAALVSCIQQEFGLARCVAQTMVTHGVGTSDQARLFLAPNLEREWINPYEIPQMKKAADRIERAVREGERVLVFGDFDLDGISATTVLTRGLRALGCDAVPFIPQRFEEGYGLTPASIERAMSYKPALIVTVDCGISCKDEAQLITEVGVDLVVTDHHEPGPMVPEDIIVVDPKCDPDCSSAILAGVGVALKLVQALGGRLGQPHLWRSLTDFATLGTVADLMPLVHENRALVADGIARMNAAPRPCLAALIEVCNMADKELSSTNLSFSLIPRLNAAGRMGNADLALDLLMTDDFELAQSKAAELDCVNSERRAIEAELAEAAKEQAASSYQGERALVVAGEGWHEGVKGIVASRLVNIYGVPALLFTIDGDEARGSGRSAGSVNLFKAVESTADILTRFGGHEAAVGVTLPAAKLPEFEKRLCAFMDALPPDSFHPLIQADAVVELDELTLEAVEDLERLAPFGQDNPVPRYLARNVRLSGCRAVGVNKNHLSCQLIDGVAAVGGIMFHCDGIDSLMACGSVVDAAFQLQIDEWRGRRSVKCLLEAIEPASACPALRACLPDEEMDFVSELYEIDRDLEVACSLDDPCGCGGLSQADCRTNWSQLAKDDPEEFERRLIRAFIGDGVLHASQRRALDALARGHSALTVMGTGRGKSLVFQVHAVRCALGAGKASVFVYPLRALLADQRFHLAAVFDKLGLVVAVLSGETPTEERHRIYAALKEGSVDVVLTTPEYLSFHAAKLAACERVGFFVVDEAHHMLQSGAGRRAAYALLGEVAEAMGNPTVLAVTATAPPEVEQAVREAFRIDEVVLDDFARFNLKVDDRRSMRDKDSYVAGIIASGEKTAVYVNSRMGTVDLARTLRTLVPQVAMQIGFYNAGLSREERERVERLFREGVLRVLVCTSAFGEGVDIPDIRHVVLYGMPFSEIEFNQMSGRAGRNGQDACIHVLFGKRDAVHNEGILYASAPNHDTMACIYRELKRFQREAEALVQEGQAGQTQAPTGAANATVDTRANAQAAPAGRGGIQSTSERASGSLQMGTAHRSMEVSVREGEVFFTISDQDLAAACMARRPRFEVGAQACACAIAVFEELDLVRLAVVGTDEAIHTLHVRATTSKVELTDSVLYREGLGDLDEFARFREWAMRSPAETLHGRIVRPMLPDES